MMHSTATGTLASGRTRTAPPIGAALLAIGGVVLVLTILAVAALAAVAAAVLVFGDGLSGLL
jgi:hypothetical protein